MARKQAPRPWWRKPQAAIVALAGLLTFVAGIVQNFQILEKFFGINVAVPPALSLTLSPLTQTSNFDVRGSEFAVYPTIVKTGSAALRNCKFQALATVPPASQMTLQQLPQDTPQSVKDGLARGLSTAIIIETDTPTFNLPANNSTYTPLLLLIIPTGFNETSSFGQIMVSCDKVSSQQFTFTLPIPKAVNPLGPAPPN
jgi:hypothetical protein